MKEIIEQISRIDAVAYENEQRKRSILINERKRLEDDIKAYRQKEIGKAEDEAQNTYKQIVSNAKNEYQRQEDEIKRQCAQIESNYEKIENAVLKEVFNKLFSD